MLMALLRGKLSRTQENLEDILTSNIFGALKYLPPEDGLLPFLSHAQTLDGKHPFESVPPGTKVEYLFWPWHAEPGCNGCEPDVELRILLPDGKKMYVFIECKYFSGKSSEEDSEEEIVDIKQEPPIDQLAREWSNLNSFAKREGAQPLLIYLTRNIGVPRDELEASQRAVLKGLSKSPFSCCWSSWHQLYEIGPEKNSPIMADIRALLERLNLVFFHGISSFSPVDTINWHFASQIDSDTSRVKIAEKSEGRSLDFSFPTIPQIGWRFKS